MFMTFCTEISSAYLEKHFQCNAGIFRSNGVILVEFILNSTIIATNFIIFPTKPINLNGNSSSQQNQLGSYLSYTRKYIVARCVHFCLYFPEVKYKMLQKCQQCLNCNLKTKNQTNEIHGMSRNQFGIPFYI